MHASINSTDATRGQPLRVRVEKRMLELRAIAAGLDDGDPTRQDIASALAVVQGMLTGPRHHLPPMVAADLNRWLERNKHLAEYVATFQRRAIAS